jgi:hypothetical protein
MQKAMLTVIALGLLAASAARAAEPSVFEVWKAACFDTRADPEKALAALGPGWRDGPPVTDTKGIKAVKMRGEGADEMQVELAELVAPKGAGGAPVAQRIRLCMVTGVRGAGLRAQVQATLGAPPTRVRADALSWVWFDGPAGRTYMARALAEDMNRRLPTETLVGVTAVENAHGGSAAFTEDVRAPE